MKGTSEKFQLLLAAGLILFLAYVAAAQCVQPPAGMVSWWPGDGNAADIADANNGTLQGGTAFATGKVGQGFRLDGLNDFVRVGNSANLRLAGSDFTVDTWVKFTSLVSPPSSPSGPCFGPGCDMSIVNKMVATNVSGEPNTDGWRMLKQSDNHLWFCLGAGGNGCADGAPTTVRSTTAVQRGVWYHVAGVRSSSAISIYVNGILEESKPLPWYLDSDSAELLIGYYPQESLMFGLVDEVEIYNRALPAQEIAAIFTAGTAGKCKPIDTTPPSCAVTGSGTDSLGQKFVKISCQDTGSGLASIQSPKSSNYTVKIPSFTKGTANPVVVTATKIDNTLNAWVTLKLSDVAGNIGFYDPVELEIERTTGKPQSQTVTGIPETESLITIYNHNPGLTALFIEVNGIKFMVPGLRDNEFRNIDVSPVMAAEDNTMTFQTHGRPGGSATILIHERSAKHHGGGRHGGGG